MGLRKKDVSYKEYISAINIYLDDVDEDDKDEVAGMIRGLMCAIEGWGAISGYTNDFLATHLSRDIFKAFYVDN